MAFFKCFYVRHCKNFPMKTSLGGTHKTPVNLPHLWYVVFNIGTPSTPVLTYKNTSHEILLSWSPVGSDGVCGPVTYNITVMPSHGMMMMINDTVYNITGLNYNTNYIITVYATNSHGGHGEPATVTVRTPSGIIYNYMYAYVQQNHIIYVFVQALYFHISIL